MKINIFLIILIVLSSIGDVDNNIKTNTKDYNILVDGYEGFYKVGDDYFKYLDYTLNININDSVTWVNDDPTDILTIISDENLFEETKLVNTGKTFDYIFDKPGVYTFRIKEYPQYKKHTIIVSEKNKITPISTETKEIKIENIAKANKSKPNGLPTNGYGPPPNTSSHIGISGLFEPLDILKNIKMISVIIAIISILFFLNKKLEKR